MMSCRLIAFGQPLQLLELQVPVPQGEEILVKVTAVGICHSDLHLIEGGYDAGKGQRLNAADRGVKLPLTLGHEIVGRPVDGATAGLDDSCDYLIYPWIGCGLCIMCLADQEHLCAQPRTLGIYRDGGYADYVLIPHARYLLPLHGIHAVSAAPYACSGLTAYSALRKAGRAFFETPIVLFGAGGLGLMALRLLQALGGKPPIVVEIDAAKREAAQQAGALATVDGNAPGALQQILHHAGGQPYAAIDFVGSDTTAALAFHCLAKGGKLICVGLFGGAAPWPLPLIPMRAITIQGNYVGTLQELKDLLQLVRDSGMETIPIRQRPLQTANASLDLLRAGQVAGRLVMLP